MFGLIIVHDQTGVNNAGNPAKQSQEKTQEKAEDPAGHQDRNWRKDDAEEVAQGFHWGMLERWRRIVKSLESYIVKSFKWQ